MNLGARIRTRAGYWAPLVVLTAAGVLAGLSVAHKRSQLVALRAQEKAFRAEVMALAREETGLRDARNRLLSDPMAIERAARNHYGFAAKGEKAAAVEDLPPRRPPEPALPSGRATLRRILVWLTYPWMVPAAVCVISAVVLKLMSPRLQAAAPATPSSAGS